MLWFFGQSLRFELMKLGLRVYGKQAMGGWPWPKYWGVWKKVEMGWNGHLWKWVVYPPNGNLQRENHQLMGMSVVAGREVEESDLLELWMLSRNWMEKIAGFTSPFSKNHPVNRIEIKHPAKKTMDMSWNVTCPFHAEWDVQTLISYDYFLRFSSLNYSAPGGTGWCSRTRKATAGRRRHRWWLHLEGPGDRLSKTNCCAGYVYLQLMC